MQKLATSRIELPESAERSPLQPGLCDDLSRDVYCILGIPIDRITLDEAAQRISDAAANRQRCFVSTPNVCFLTRSLHDAAFRQSLLMSDLCTADGMPIFWIARRLGVPLPHKVSGSDVFERLKDLSSNIFASRVFFFGGADGVAARAAAQLDKEKGELRSAGAISPGFGSIAELSSDKFLRQINSSHAEYLLVALGAAKGQAWLQANRNGIQIPVRFHLGAVIDFQAGRVRRAPSILQRLGLEWLWRIKEEPQLWHRYWQDGVTLLRLCATNLLPLLINTPKRHAKASLVVAQADSSPLTLRLCGSATCDTVDRILPHITAALDGSHRAVVIDLTSVHYVDPRFLGLLMMIKKCAADQSTVATFVGASHSLRRLFRLHCAEFLLEPA